MKYPSTIVLSNPIPQFINDNDNHSYLLIHVAILVSNMFTKTNATTVKKTNQIAILHAFLFSFFTASFRYLSLLSDLLLFSFLQIFSIISSLSLAFCSMPFCFRANCRSLSSTDVCADCSSVSRSLCRWSNFSLCSHYKCTTIRFILFAK